MLAPFQSKQGIARARWQFRLWHLLAGITCLAILLSTLHVSSAITITLLVSIFPGAATMLLFKRMSCSSTRRIATFVWFASLWFLIYALSIGPAMKLTLAMGWKINLEIPYSPVIWLYHNTFLNGPIEWYITLWSRSC